MEPGCSIRVRHELTRHSYGQSISVLAKFKEASSSSSTAIIHMADEYEPDAYSVRVIARVRPMNHMELGRGEHEAAAVDPQRPATMQLAMPGPGGRAQNKDFNFDYCIAGDSSQQQFFANSGVTDLLDSALDGWVLCCLISCRCAVL